MEHQENIEIRHRAKKDKRKWCKGKVNVPHDFVYQFSWNRFYSSEKIFSVYVCSKCEKKQYRDEKYNPEIHNKRQKLVKNEGRDYHEFEIIEK